MAKTGTLKIILINSKDQPVARGTVIVNGDGRSYNALTDRAGIVSFILPAPPKALSQSPTVSQKPYTQYNVRIAASGYVPVTVVGEQLFDGIITVRRVVMQTSEEYPDLNEKRIVTPEHERYIGSMRRTSADIGEAAAEASALPVKRRVVVPETITVHLGAPNAIAENVTVPFIDYIKSVASSEIYPTWPEAALRANIIAQVSLALNRIYTEWYPSQGYDFDITSSSAYDQYYVHERSIFDNISALADELFTNYLARANAIEPVFTQYCDGATVSCEGMSQWGTVTLANRGFDPLDILRYYFGQDTYIAEAEVTQEPTESFAGDLYPGSENVDVATLQRRLIRIAINYPQIPFIVRVDGKYGPQTEEAVKAFQRVFGLDPTGVTDRETWYRVQYVYTAVKKLAELGSEGERVESDAYARYLQLGDRGTDVLRMQYYLRVIADAIGDDSIPRAKTTGVFDDETRAAVAKFQEYFGLPTTGAINEDTWNAIVDTYYRYESSVWQDIEYPGTPLRIGSEGRYVTYIQNALNTVGARIPGMTELAPDGYFGPVTQAAVKMYQSYSGLEPDGIVGPQTWNKLSSEYRALMFGDSATGSVG